MTDTTAGRDRSAAKLSSASQAKGADDRRRRRRLRLRRVGLYAMVSAACAVMAFPLYWMFATAVRPKSEVFSRDLLLWPSTFVWSNFSEAWTARPFTNWYVNSIGIALIACAITVFINLLAGYTFAKLEFYGRNVLFILIISTLMIPVQVVMIPNFLLVSSVGGLNTWWAVILPRAAEAFGIFMVRQFMLAIPDELLEAARVDGAGELRIFLRIVVPLSGPVIAVLAIFTFMWRWNDFAWPLVVLLDHEAFTVPLGLRFLLGEGFAREWTEIMAMSLVSIIPVLVVFIFFQRKFVQGIANTGIK